MNKPTPQYIKDMMKDKDIDVVYFLYEMIERVEYFSNLANRLITEDLNKRSMKNDIKRLKDIYLDMMIYVKENEGIISLLAKDKNLRFMAGLSSIRFYDMIDFLSKEGIEVCRPGDTINRDRILGENNEYD